VATCNVPWIGPDYNIEVVGLNDTQVIDTACAGDVTISMSISHLGKLETSGAGLDTLQVFYEIDGNVQSWLNIQGDAYTSPSEITVPSGAQLTIRTVGRTTHSSETYQIRSFAVTAAGTPTTPSPTKSPTSSPTTSPIAPVTQSPTVSVQPSSTPVATCDVPWVGPDYNISSAGLNNTQVIDTSCAGDVTISMSISNLGSLESSGPSQDFLRVTYRIDGGQVQVWLDIKGQVYTSPASITVPSGTVLTIQVAGDTTSKSEVYQIRNFGIVAS